MAGKQKVKKGLPKRTGKPQMKAMCEASNRRCQARKAKRVAENTRRAERNRRYLRDIGFSGTATERRKVLNERDA